MQVFVYDSEGLYIGSKFVDEIEENMTTIPILVGHIKPKFDTKLNEWVEGATEKEITDWKNKQPVSEPTEMEVLKKEKEALAKSVYDLTEIVELIITGGVNQ